MASKKKTTRRAYAVSTPEHVFGLLLVGVVLFSVAYARSFSSWKASVSDSESICVGVFVVGLDNGDPGPMVCNPGQIVEESSSSSQSSSESSSESSATSETSGATSSASGPFGNYRHDPDRILDLITQWADKHAVHPAAPAHCDEYPYNDVHMRAWYYIPVWAFYRSDYLDTTTCFFRPLDGALRSEFAKLLVVMAGGIKTPTPSVGSFTDVPAHTWYYPYVEEAGRRGWMIGFDDCYGTMPCYDKPANTVSRAEAVQMVVRYFHFKRTGKAPRFIDVPNDQWYARSVQIAADHCVLLGDDVKKTARPTDIMNRAEMVTMLARAELDMTYGVDCGSESGISPQLVSPARPVTELIPREEKWQLCSGGVITCMYKVLSSQATAFFLSILNH